MEALAYAAIHGDAKWARLAMDVLRSWHDLCCFLVESIGACVAALEHCGSGGINSLFATGCGLKVGSGLDSG